MGRLATLGVGLGLTISQAVSAATVYVVLASDTSIWSTTSGQSVEGTDMDSPVVELDTAVFSNPNGVYRDVFDDAFRLAHADSRGHPFVVTWFMHGGGWFQTATNLDTVGATTLIRHHWQGELDRWGDQIAYHFHHFKWDRHWMMADTWEDALWDFEWTLSQMILDHGILPVSYRSGWNYMDNPYQQTLERWIPFRMEGGSWMTRDVPYHPSFADYRLPGTMLGWEVRHRYMKDVTLAVANQIFGWAAAGQDQVTCIWSHQNEADFIAQIASVDANLHAAAAAHPGVEFRYCTASEAMRLWQGSDDVAPPYLDCALSPGPGPRTLTIETGPDIFQVGQPCVAARLMSDECVLLGAHPVGPGLWEVPDIGPEVDLLSVAVCDLAGNVAIREVRDGSRRWSTQPEFVRAALDGLDAWKTEGQLTLRRDDRQPLVAQTEGDGATPTISRAYWIGQTFTPSRPGLSRVEFGVNLISGPAEILVELRTVGAGGFPDDSDSGLLAAGNVPVTASGDVSVDLPFSGFVLDGRRYALVFKRVSGQTQIRLHRTGSYAGGNLTRAFSMGWIHIDAFDCRFQTFDQFGIPDQGQAAYDSQTYTLERGRFLSQTVDLGTASHLDTVEVSVAAASQGDTLEVQLRRTLPDGRPDLTWAGLIATRAQSVAGPGSLEIAANWEIPEPDRGRPLALTFTSPQSGRSSIALVHRSGNPYPGGALWQSDDLVTTSTGSDLWFRVLAAGYRRRGTATWDFDAEQPVLWTTGAWDASVEAGVTAISARFAFADDRAGLDAAPWTPALLDSPFALPGSPLSRWVRVEVAAESSDGAQTPVLRDLTLNYLLPGTTVVQSGLTYR